MISIGISALTSVAEEWISFNLYRTQDGELQQDEIGNPDVNIDRAACEARFETSNLSKNSAIIYLVRDARSQNLPDMYWPVARSPGFKYTNNKGRFNHVVYLF